MTIVDEKGEMKVKHETNIVAVHFRLADQLRGFSISYGPSQVTWRGAGVSGLSECFPDERDGLVG